VTDPRIALHVLIDGRHAAGVDGYRRRVRLLYDADPGPVPLSLSMPTAKRRWPHAAIHPWVSALLPDDERTLARWRQQFQVLDHDPMALLPHIGEDVAGAAQFVREDRLEAVLDRPGDIIHLSKDQVGRLLEAARTAGPFPEPARGRFSLAGAQAKIALRRQDDGWALPDGAEPSTHVLKLPVPGLADQLLAEAMTTRAASRLGLATVTVELADIAGQPVIVVERYDRRLVDGAWRRVHQEDLVQAAGGDPRRKYEDQGGPGVAACAALLRRHAGDAAVEGFAQAVMFNHLVQGTDAHARNYSVLLPADAPPALAPLYDLNAGLPHGPGFAQHAAMAVGGEFRFAAVGPLQWRGFAHDCGLDHDWVVARLRRLAADLPDALSEAGRAVDMPPDSAPWVGAFVVAAAAWCRTAAPK
jgi:serine/threonine-protein kinase HipA